MQEEEGVGGEEHTQWHGGALTNDAQPQWQKTWSGMIAVTTSSLPGEVSGKVGHEGGAPTLDHSR